MVAEEESGWWKGGDVGTWWRGGGEEEVSISPELGGEEGMSGGGGYSFSEELGQPLEIKQRFVWTAELHARFVAAVTALGLHTAKPKSIAR